MIAQASSTRSTARRDELVEVALEVLERDGFNNLSIGAIARSAGIKPPSLYKQFASKDDIEVRLIARGFELMASEIDAAAATVTPGVSHREQLGLLARAYRGFGHHYPQLYLLMHSRPYPENELGPQNDQSATFYFRQLLPEAEMAGAAWSWAHGLLSLEISRRLPDGDGESLWAMVTDTVEEMYRRAS